MKKIRILLLLLCIVSIAHGHMFVKWKFAFSGDYNDWMIYGSSPAVANFEYNALGGEPDSFLEIVVGSDEIRAPYYPLYGAWRLIDAYGNLEWHLCTRTDESRSSPAVSNFAGDAVPEVVGGTTSGWSVEAFDSRGAFLWRFGLITGTGTYMWHSSPAIADIDTAFVGSEVVIGCSNALCPALFCLQADISAGIDDGYIGYSGAEHACWVPSSIGTDGAVGNFDVLWFAPLDGPTISTPAVADLNDDGENEIVLGTGWRRMWECGARDGVGGSIVCFDKTGALLWAISTAGAYPHVPASPAVADVDGDVDSEVFIGASDGWFYCIDGDENGDRHISYWEMAGTSFGAPIYSSAAAGDIDGDGNVEIVFGDGHGFVNCIRYFPAGDSVVTVWQTKISDTLIISSPSLADTTSQIAWGQFRANAAKTGFVELSGGVRIYIGTLGGYVYELDGFGVVRDSIRIGYSVVTSPAIADIDGDCFAEVVVVAAQIGETLCDTLVCIGTDLRVKNTCPECLPISAEHICPSSAFELFSCTTPRAIFEANFDARDRLDTMRIFGTIELRHSTGVSEFIRVSHSLGVRILSFSHTRSWFELFSSHEPMNGDTVIFVVDSIFSVRGCKWSF